MFSALLDLDIAFSSTSISYSRERMKFKLTSLERLPVSWAAIVRASWSFERFRSALVGGNEDEACGVFLGAGVG